MHMQYAYIVYNYNKYIDKFISLYNEFLEWMTCLRYLWTHQIYRTFDITEWKWKNWNKMQMSVIRQLANTSVYSSYFMIKLGCIFIYILVYIYIYNVSIYAKAYMHYIYINWDKVCFNFKLNCLTVVTWCEQNYTKI